MELKLSFLETSMKSSFQSSLTCLAFEWKQTESDSGKRYSRRQFHYLPSVSSSHNIEGYEKNMMLCVGLVLKRNLAVTNKTSFCAEMESVLPKALFSSKWF